MTTSFAAKAVAFALAVTSTDAIQRIAPREKAAYVRLDQTEAEDRGALCLDGTAPGFYYKSGGTSNKWIIFFAGGGYCEDEDECFENSQDQSHPQDGDERSESADPLILDSDTFADYNHVVFDNCDRSLYSGDAVFQHSGKTVYLRGKRILDYAFDTLKSIYALHSATEVLITGGSGGGHSVFVLSDYVHRQMPASVKKFGAVPMNGWYPCVGYQGKDAAGASQSSLYNLHNMSGMVSPRCTDQFSPSEHWRCICADVSYKHRVSPMFVVQLLDPVSYGAYDQVNTNRVLECIGPDATEWNCANNSIGLLQEFMNDVVDALKSSKTTADGAFLSTCTQHNFYLSHDGVGDGYSKYKSQDGKGVDEAISGWWQSMGTTAGPMYLPCTLNEEFPRQCEASCTV